MSELLFDILLYTTRGVPHTHLLATTEGVDDFFRNMAQTYRSTDTFFGHDVVITIRPHTDEELANELQARLDAVMVIANGD